MKEFKFFQKNEGLDNFIRENIPNYDVRILRNSLYGALRVREVAVIASSVRDFNEWRRGIFDRVFVVTNREFVHTNGNNNQMTRYRAITNMDDCQGLTFDDCVRTSRISDILRSDYYETIDYIIQLITEVKSNIREDGSL